MKKKIISFRISIYNACATACGTSADDGNKTSKADKTVHSNIKQ